MSVIRFFDVKTDESQYVLSDFTFENLKINAKVNGFDENAIRNVKKNVKVTLWKICSVD